jgi:hypothetical protein
MTRASRSSVAGMVAIALIAALGLAAMRLGSELLAGIMFLVTYGVLCLAFIALLCRGPAERAWWLGFNVFGWIYDRFALRAWGEVRPWLPTTRLLELLATMAGFTIDSSRPPRPGDQWAPFFVAGQCLFTLLLAVIGGFVAVVLFGNRPGKTTDNPVEQKANAVALRDAWIGPAIIYVIALALAAALAAFCSNRAPEIWAAAMFLLTWGLVGVAEVGVVVSHGRRREVCIGASLLGVGFTLLVFSRTQQYQEWPGFPTIQFLNALRPWMPPAVRGSPADSYEIGLEYYVSDGLLNIDSDLHEMYLQPPDPYLVAGQCLMALMAIGVGGILAPVVSDVRWQDAA